MATLKDVATVAGVHLATASTILNRAGGNTRVSEATRERVLSAARLLEYVPNEAARRLRRKESDTVGFLGGDLRNPFFAELGAALEAALSEYDLRLMISHVAQTEGAMRPAIVQLQHQGVQRILCWEEGGDAPVQNDSESLLSIGFTLEKRPGVWLDLKRAMDIAVDSMAAQGFRQLGFYGPQGRRESPSVEARLAAFEKACRRLRLPPPVVKVYAGESWDLMAATRTASDVLREHSGVEGWIGFNDVASLGLLNRIPRNASKRVFCFDGTAATRCWPGGPACLDLKIAELAATCARLLVNPAPEKTVVLRPQRSL